MFDPRTLPTNLTSVHAWVLFGLMATSIIAMYGDYVTTVKGLAAGDVEGNKLMAWLFTKIGQPATAFLSSVVVIAIALGLSTWHSGPDMLFCGGITIGEAYMYFRNSKLLKAAGK